MNSFCYVLKNYLAAHRDEIFSKLQKFVRNTNLSGLPKLANNGTAIGVVCVTGAANRLTVPFVMTELSRWQAGMAQYLQSRVRLVSVSRYKDERL